MDYAVSQLPIKHICGNSQECAATFLTNTWIGFPTHYQRSVQNYHGNPSSLDYQSKKLEQICRRECQYLCDLPINRFYASFLLAKGLNGEEWARSYLVIRSFRAVFPDRSPSYKLWVVSGDWTVRPRTPSRLSFLTDTGNLRNWEVDADVDDPGVAQPVCTALQIALVDLCHSWRLRPKAVVGHNSGEIAAAYCAGGLSHESAIKVAFHRGSLAARLAQGSLNQGAMVSVAHSGEEMEPFIVETNKDASNGRIQIGCVNSPTNVTVTGDQRGISMIDALMESKGVFSRKLRVNVAYHSNSMYQIANEYLALVRGIIPRYALGSNKDPELPKVFSSVTGSIISAESLSQPEFWVQNLVSKVKFYNAINQMASHLLEDLVDGSNRQEILVELGPSSTLQRSVQDTLATVAGCEDVSYDSILKRDESATETCLALIGKLWTHNYQVDLVPVNCLPNDESELQRLVDLPRYPFNHTNHYWAEGLPYA